MEINDHVERLVLAVKSLTVTRNDDLKKTIREIVNDLIENDLARLVQFLYRVDVNETKLKQLLQDNPQTDAAVLITDLLIERQLEKIKAKQDLKKEDDIPDEEKW